MAKLRRKGLILFFALLFSSHLHAERVDINTADASLIAAQLPGLGIRRAEAIVRYRNENGSFSTVDDLAKVPGITLKHVDMCREFITVIARNDSETNR